MAGALAWTDSNDCADEIGRTAIVLVKRRESLFRQIANEKSNRFDAVLSGNLLPSIEKLAVTPCQLSLEA